MNNHASEKIYAQPHGVSYWRGFVLSATCILLIFELFIRIFILQPPMVEYRPGWGIVPVENSHALYGLEGFAVTHFLENGEVSTPFSEGEISIVVLGDSTTRSAQVANSENYVSLTEIELRAYGFDVDMHNLGRQDRSVADFVYLAPFVNVAYEPDVIVLQVNPNTFELSLNARRDSYFAPLGNDQLELVHNESFLPEDLAYARFISHSGLLSLLDYRAKKSLPVSKFSTREQADLNAQTPPADNKSELAIQDTGQTSLREYGRKLLPQINALRAAYPDSKLVFLIIPYVPSFRQIPGEPESWADNTDYALVTVLNQIDRDSLVYPLESFRELYGATHNVPRGFFNSAFNYGHLNRLGQQVVANELSVLLEEILK